MFNDRPKSQCMWAAVGFLTISLLQIYCRAYFESILYIGQHLTSSELSRWKMKNSALKWNMADSHCCNSSKLRSYDVPLILTPGKINIKPMQPNIVSLTDIIGEWLMVRSLLHFATTSLFLVAPGAYSRFLFLVLYLHQERLCFRRCLSVFFWLLATLRRNFRIDLHEIFRESLQLPDEQMVKFWWRSGSPSGYSDCFLDSSLLRDTESGINRLRCASRHRHSNYDVITSPPTTDIHDRRALAEVCTVQVLLVSLFFCFWFRAVD